MLKSLSLCNKVLSSVCVCACVRACVRVCVTVGLCDACVCVSKQASVCLWARPAARLCVSTYECACICARARVYMHECAYACARSHQKRMTPPIFNASETASTEPRIGPSKLSTDQPCTQHYVIIENYITLHTK